MILKDVARMQTYITNNVLKLRRPVGSLVVECYLCPVWCERPGFESKQWRNF